MGGEVSHRLYDAEDETGRAVIGGEWIIPIQEGITRTIPNLFNSVLHHRALKARLTTALGTAALIRPLVKHVWIRSPGTASMFIGDTRILLMAQTRKPFDRRSTDDLDLSSRLPT